jgi:hypothetical protein
MMSLTTRRVLVNLSVLRHINVGKKLQNALRNDDERKKM